MADLAYVVPVFSLALGMDKGIFRDVMAAKVFPFWKIGDPAQRVRKSEAALNRAEAVAH